MGWASACALWIPAFEGMTGHPHPSARASPAFASLRVPLRFAKGRLFFELAAFYEVVEEVGVGF